MSRSCVWLSAATCTISIRIKAVNSVRVCESWRFSCSSAHQASHVCDMDVSVINQKYKLLFTETLISYSKYCLEMSRERGN